MSDGRDLESHRTSEDEEKISGLTEDIQVELGFCLFNICLLGVAEDWVHCSSLGNARVGKSEGPQSCESRKVK